MKTKQELIKQWVTQYTGVLYAWAYTKIKDKAMAEDLVQDTFLVALESADKFREESAPKTWLFGILNNKINDYFRKQGKAPLPFTSFMEEGDDYFFESSGHWKSTTAPSAWHEESHLLDNPEFTKILNFCLEKLPGSWGEILLAKYMLGKKSKIICQENQITETNYWQIIHRAKLTMRDCIDNNWRE